MVFYLCIIRSYRLCHSSREIAAVYIQNIHWYFDIIKIFKEKLIARITDSGKAYICTVKVINKLFELVQFFTRMHFPMNKGLVYCLTFQRQFYSELFPERNFIWIIAEGWKKVGIFSQATRKMCEFVKK